MQANDIKTITVIGAGTMGEGIAQNFAEAGINVRLVARHQETLDKCLTRILSYLKMFEEFKLLREQPSVICSRISTTTTEKLKEALDGCDFVVETIPELLDAKKELLAQLDRLPKEVAIGSNTSSFTIATLTAGMKTPQRVLGMHYFNPANIIPLVEIHGFDAVPADIVELTRGLIVRAGKKPVLIKKELPGFLINRITGAVERETDYLLDEGVVTPEDLDAAVKASIGFRWACLGPQEAEDMIGLDTAARVGGAVYKTLSNRVDVSSMLLEKVKKGELGIKAGKGWYDYSGKTREQVMGKNNRIFWNSSPFGDHDKGNSIRPAGPEQRPAGPAKE